MTAMMFAVPFVSMALGFCLGWFGYGLAARRGERPARDGRDGMADDVTNIG